MVAGKVGAGRGSVVGRLPEPAGATRSPGGSSAAAYYIEGAVSPIDSREAASSYNSFEDGKVT